MWGGCGCVGKREGRGPRNARRDRVRDGRTAGVGRRHRVNEKGRSRRSGRLSLRSSTLSLLFGCRCFSFLSAFALFLCTITPPTRRQTGRAGQGASAHHVCRPAAPSLCFLRLFFLGERGRRRGVKQGQEGAGGGEDDVEKQGKIHTERGGV